MIFELTVRISTSVSANEQSTQRRVRLDKLLQVSRIAVFSLATMGFAVFEVLVVRSVLASENYVPFSEHFSAYTTTIAYLFLFMGVLMASVNIALFIVIKVKSNKLGSGMTHKFKREQSALAIILTIFELSYITRFIWDVKITSNA